MKRLSPKEAQQSKKGQKSEDAKAETDNEDTVGTRTLKLERELWADDDQLSSDDGEKEKK